MDTLENALFQQLASACSEVRQSFDQLVGMSQTRRQLLILLSEIGEVTHATLQQQLLLDGATITRLVKQFEAEGVLTRRLGPQDNRYTLVSLTPSGQKIVTKLREAHSAFQTHLLVGIKREEQETLVRVLGQLRTNIRTKKQMNQ